MSKSKTTWQLHQELVDAGYVFHKDEDGVWHCVQPGPGGYTVYSARYKGLCTTESYKLLNPESP